MKEEALEFLRSNLEQYEIAAIRAQVDAAYDMHLSPSDCVRKKQRVIDLLDDFGAMHDFEQSWWEEYGTIDDYLMEL